MTLQQLEYLIALDKHRQFAKAALHCNVTQPTLSTMVQRLEEELGVTLIDRSKQPIRPTAIGEKIIHQAKRALAEADTIHTLIDEERESLSGHIRIGVLPTIAPFLLPKVIPFWDTDFKKISVEIIELKTSECLAHLQERTIDMAILASEAQTEGLRDDLLFFEEFVGYVSQNEKIFEQSLIRSSEVEGARLWLLDEGHCFRDQLVRFCQLTSFQARKQKYSQGSLMAFMHLVELGEGLTFIPSLALDYLSDEQKKHVRQFAIPRPVREIRLAYREDYVRSSIVSNIIESIKKSVPRTMLTLAVGQQIAK